MAATKEETIKDIYQELQKVRFELSKASLKKTGKNKYAGFEYFELADFLPKATELFMTHGLTPIFRIEFDSLGVEYAYLTIIKGNEQVMFKAPTANPRSSEKTPNPIQELGSKITYMRRYLYLMALDIVENDQVDATIGQEKETNSESCTPGQIATIKANGKLIASELEQLGIKTPNDIQTLSKVKASELISLIKERQTNEQG